MAGKIGLWWMGIGSLVVCVLVMAAVIAGLLWQWRKMDRILEAYLQEEVPDLETLDVQETRESRVISQLSQILRNASWKEARAKEEQNQVMQLVSDLSHQLKTPLANIVMNMEILSGGTLDEESRKEFQERTRMQAEKMQWLMADLLKASRLENGSMEFQAGAWGIRETLAQAVGSVYAQAAKKNIAITVEEMPERILWHNPKWTAEAIANLLENAVKYSPEGSTVTICAVPQELYTGIAVSDQGIGIPESEYNQIFRRFYRGKQTEQREGSGLGLYLAQLIAQKEKGYITVNSRPGRGSCFTLFLLNRKDR